MTEESRGAASDDEISDDEQQLIKLSLKKPKLWNWELTTSKSSSCIAFPTIQLFDENSQTLLAVAHEADFVASSKMCGSALSSEASSLRSTCTRDSFKIKITRDSVDVEPLMKPSDDAADVRRKRSSSLKFVGHNHNTKRSVSSTSVRSRSSILERISEMKKDISSSSSSDEEAEKISDSDDRRQVVKMDKKYSYRTSKVGTLLVPKESSSTDATQRRRPRKPYQDNNSSSEVDKLINSCTGEWQF